MTTTRQQIEMRLMEMLGTDATERDAERAFDWLLARGYIVPGWVLNDVPESVWSELLATFNMVRFDAETGYCTIKCLAPENGGSLRCSSILVEFDDDGFPRDPATGMRWFATRHSDDLRGWGELDGPCYSVTRSDDLPAGPEVLIPVAAWTAMMLA